MGGEHRPVFGLAVPCFSKRANFFSRARTDTGMRW